MARTAVAAVAIAQNATTLDAGGTTYDVSNGMVLSAFPENNLIRLTNTDDDTGLTVTFLAGVNPPARAAGQGNLAVTVAFGTTRILSLESGRFLQADGTVKVDVTVNTGKITVFKVPRH